MLFKQKCDGISCGYIPSAEAQCKAVGDEQDPPAAPVAVAREAHGAPSQSTTSSSAELLFP